MKAFFQPGISALLGKHRSWLAGRRIGLVSHPAAVDPTGTSSAERLHSDRRVNLVSLFGPEHGYFGAATAGESVGTRRHPRWGIPIHSLYGKHRRPTPAMLRNIDALVFDLQDLGVRPYTYVSTLRYILEEAAAQGKEVIIADRPIPLPRVVDGPLPEPRYQSFVASVPVPVAYGMTPGETALWLRRALSLDVDLKVACLQHYHRESARGRNWPPWIAPSPGIRSWESALCYPATVFCEALPALDYGRGTNLPFQVVGAPWMKGEAVCKRLLDMHLPGVVFHSHPYYPATGNTPAPLVEGLRMVVTRPDDFRPVLTGLAILHVIQELYGRSRLWKARGTRLGFFDKLMGTPVARQALVDGKPPRAIASRWRAELATFSRSRHAALLYDPN